MSVLYGMEVLEVEIRLEFFIVLAKIIRTPLNYTPSAKTALRLSNTAYTEIRKCSQEYSLSNR
jgi:hypothetical protein